MKKEKEICATFAVSPQTANIMAAIIDKRLITIEKALNMCTKMFLCEAKPIFTYLLL